MRIEIAPGQKLPSTYRWENEPPAGGSGVAIRQADGKRVTVYVKEGAKMTDKDLSARLDEEVDTDPQFRPQDPNHPPGGVGSVMNQQARQNESAEPADTAAQRTSRSTGASDSGSTRSAGGTTHR